MPLIFVSGFSGAGKTSVCRDLVKRGYEAHDTDEPHLSRWRNLTTGHYVDWPRNLERDAEWYKNHAFILSPERVRALAAQAKDRLIFLCGIPSNDLALAKHYDMIFFLYIDRDTMQHRLATRETNSFGKDPKELAHIMQWYQPTLDKYTAHEAIMLDATRPLTAVVDDILERITARPTA